MKVLRIALFLCLAAHLAYSQTDPLAHFSFDDCMATDQMGVFADGEIVNGVDCDCGVGLNSSAMYFDGLGDTITMDQDIKSVFDGDFSVSFYLWMDNVSSITSILSIQGDCSSARDSAFFVRYFPASNEVVVELSKNFGEVISLRATLSDDNCWNHVLFTREDQVYSLYLNGEFVERFTFLDQVVLGVNHPIWIGVSPCTGINEQAFRGRIDDLRLYNAALKTESELNSLLLFPDQILTADTTIFEGSSIDILTAPSCASSISWTPGINLNDPFSANPIADPTETTIYTVEFDHGSCVSTDQVTVSVLSEDEISCGNILLPKAFTPNNDGINELYGISNSFIIEDLNRFEIYDRWGLKLFETTDKNIQWDGSYKSEKMPPGTYVYKLEYTCMGQSYRRTSNFNILK